MEVGALDYGPGLQNTELNGRKTPSLVEKASMYQLVRSVRSVQPKPLRHSELLNGDIRCSHENHDISESLRF